MTAPLIEDVPTLRARVEYERARAKDGYASALHALTADKYMRETERVEAVLLHSAGLFVLNRMLGILDAIDDPENPKGANFTTLDARLALLSREALRGAVQTTGQYSGGEYGHRAVENTRRDAFIRMAEYMSKDGYGDGGLFGWDWGRR